MRAPLLYLLLLGPAAGFAQNTSLDATAAPPLIAVASAEPAAAMPVRTDATQKIAKMKGTIGLLADGLEAFKNRPKVAMILAESADDFAQIASGLPSEAAYLQVLDNGLAQLVPLTRLPMDRMQVAEYYEDLLDVVGVGSSGGRLDAFVSRKAKAKAQPHS